MSAGIGHRTRDRDKHRTQSFMRREASMAAKGLGRENPTPVARGTPRRFVVVAQGTSGYERLSSGHCAACGSLALLPQWADGQCFLCVSDGRMPTGAYEPTIGALGEDQVAADPTADWTDLDERQREIRELFAEEQERSRYVIGFDERGGFVGSRRIVAPDAIVVPSWRRPLSPLARFRRDRGHRPRNGNNALDDATIALIHEHEKLGASLRTISAAVGVSKNTVHAYVGPRGRLTTVAKQESIAPPLLPLSPLTRFKRDRGRRRRGASNALPDATILQIHEHAAGGATIREIAAVVGVSKDTVAAYVGPRDRSAGLRRFHQRRKVAGQPIVPPWHAKRLAARPETKGP